MSRVFQIVNDGKFKKNLPEKNRRIDEIGVSSGLRISDVVKLRKNQIINTNRPTITQQKTKKKKRIYIGEKTYKNLLSFIASDLSDNEFVFHAASEAEKHISRQAVWKAFRRAAKKAGVIYPVGTHCMRKKYSAKKYAISGGDISEVQHHLQHFKSSDTLAYIMPPPTQKRSKKNANRRNGTPQSS